MKPTKNNEINLAFSTTSYAYRFLLSVYSIQGTTYFANTPNDAIHAYDYIWATTDTNYLEFEVMACNDAHIALTQSPGNTSYNTFEVVIGGWGNTKSVIRDAKGVSLFLF
jgi:hypothetical protein